MDEVHQGIGVREAGHSPYRLAVLLAYRVLETGEASLQGLLGQLGQLG
jgi:hypothetical protein